MADLHRRYRLAPRPTRPPTVAKHFCARSSRPPSAPPYRAMTFSLYGFAAALVLGKLYSPQQGPVDRTAHRLSPHTSAASPASRRRRHLRSLATVFVVRGP